MDNSFRYLFFLSLALLLGCKNPGPTKIGKIEGKTMGTTYHITLADGLIEKDKIDSLLVEINQSLSTYIPESLISQINSSSDTLTVHISMLTDYFVENAKISTQVFSWSNKRFDPTVMPLVNLWGFGYKKRQNHLPDSSAIDSVMQFVGWEKFEIQRTDDSVQFIKTHPQLEVDFSAVAKGYGIDIISEYLSQQGFKNHMVEIGGEVRCTGKPNEGRPWTLGISSPKEGGNTQDFTAYVDLENRSMATSGNYRQFYEMEGRKVTHSIDPTTGHSAFNEILSATIIADNCATADALATSCMILGLQEAKKMMLKLPKMEGYLIYSSNNTIKTWKTSGFPLK